jgi:uncharacterized protein (TIGR03437 family)
MRTRSFFLAFALAAAVSAQTPEVFEGGVVNGASFAAGQQVTPGSLVSIFGNQFAAESAFADTVPLSNQLGNVSVTFNGIPAPLHAVHAGQINTQLPWSLLPAGMDAVVAEVVVTRGGVTSAPRNVQVARFSPGIFTVNFGIGQAIAINFPDPTLAAPRGSIPGLETRPARMGDTVILLGTGLGDVDVPMEDGNNSLDQLRWTTNKPEVLIGGVPVKVEFHGMSPQFVGVNQVNIVIDQEVPKGDAVPIQFRLGGITSTDQATIAIE